MLTTWTKSISKTQTQSRLALWKSHKKFSLPLLLKQFFFFFFPSYFSGGYALLSPCPLLPERGRKPNMTAPSFLGWKVSPKPQHIDEIQHLREPPTSLMLKPLLARLRETVCCATPRTSNNPLIYSTYIYNNKPPF